MMEKVRLGDVCIDMHQGINTVADKIQYCEKGYPIIQSKNITKGILDTDDVRYIDRDKYMFYKEKYQPNKNDILIANIGTIGKSIVIDEIKEFLIAWNIFLIKVNQNKINSKYLNFYFNYLYRNNYYNKFLTGGTVKFINKKTMSNIEIPKINLKEQIEIVNKLDKVQEIIDFRKKQIEELDELIKAQFIEKLGKEKYTKIKLGEEFEISSGGTPSKNKEEYWNSNDISWIGSNMCQNKIIYENDGKYISNLGLEHSSAKVYPIDTVLVALVGATIGKTALLKFETATNQNIAAIQISKRFNAEYVYFAIQNLYYKFIELSKGTFKMANLSFVRNLKIPMPPIELQNQFADFVKQIDKQKFILEKALKETEELQESLMNKYFK